MYTSSAFCNDNDAPDERQLTQRAAKGHWTQMARAIPESLTDPAAWRALRRPEGGIGQDKSA